MLHLLAQAIEAPEVPKPPTERQIAAAEAAVEKLLSGIDAAADAQPVQYLNVLVILAVLVVISLVAWKIFGYLREKDAAEAAARAERAAEERAQREHMQTLAAQFHAAQLTASSTCHDHSMRMLTERNEGSQILRECVGEVRGVVVELKAGLHDVRNVVNENKLLIENFLLDKKSPTVGIQVNSPGKVVREPIVEPEG
jgi:hypothetical protein